MDKNSKVEYVKSQGQTRVHHCHWPNCKKNVPPAMWGCKEHWFKLPKELRDRVWDTYVPGQEVNMSPSKEYIKVAGLVQEWIENYLKNPPPKKTRKRPAQKSAPVSSLPKIILRKADDDGF